MRPPCTRTRCIGNGSGIFVLYFAENGSAIFRGCDFQQIGVAMQRAVVMGNTMAGPVAIHNDIPDCGDSCAILANVQ